MDEIFLRFFHAPRQFFCRGFFCSKSISGPSSSFSRYWVVVANVKLLWALAPDVERSEDIN